MKEEQHAMLQQQGQGYNEDATRQVVLLEDITLVIDVALIAALCVAVQLLRRRAITIATFTHALSCLLYTSPSPRDQRGSRMPSSA